MVTGSEAVSNDPDLSLNERNRFDAFDDRELSHRNKIHICGSWSKNASVS